MAKAKIKKPGFFVVPFTLPEKPLTFSFFWQEKRMRKKTWISYCFFGKWCACAISLYLWPYVVRSMLRAAGDSADWRSRPTWPKTWIIPVSGERAFTLAKNQWKTGGVSKNHTSEVGFSISFLAVFSCLATSSEKPECQCKPLYFMTEGLH